MGRSEAAYFAGLTSRGILQTCLRDSQHQRTFKPFCCFVLFVVLVWFGFGVLFVFVCLRFFCFVFVFIFVLFWETFLFFYILVLTQCRFYILVTCCHSLSIFKGQNGEIHK